MLIHVYASNQIQCISHTHAHMYTNTGEKLVGKKGFIRAGKEIREDNGVKMTKTRYMKLLINF